MASKGQIIPQRSMRGKQDPIAIFMASMDVLHTVDKKKPKLIPAKPKEIKVYIILNSEYNTLEEREDDKPGNRSTAGQLEYQEYSDQSDGSLGIRLSDVLITLL